ncbi:MAG: gamma-D-glutamyl-meso-diaminopimelate peptidase [Clostridiales bacterium]|jgi:g-D-glutamyl-meso-diaminopimelate peptidase|nr:gamma-D-glutamyl-meso-diaminopimelate peptidase [Clostridiales bacterium]
MDRIVTPQPATYENVRSMIYRINRKYPFVNCTVCGRSLAGRAIFVLSAGNLCDPVLIVAGVHGSEWLTTLASLTFFENVCRSVCARDELRGVCYYNLLKSRGIVVVPCLNPDGVQISIMGEQGAGSYSELVREVSGGMTSEWKANAGGVDLNHNFNAGWEELRREEIEAGILSAAPTRYGGERPESEPETAALVSLTRRVCPRHVIALHSQGEEIFWRYGEAVPERSERMANTFSAVSGFSLVDNAGMYSHGGYKDWFIKEFRRPGFTIEMGKGKNPLPLSDFKQAYPPVEEILAASTIM